MDFMKKTNDLYGHDMGDSAIKEIASIILKVISKEDIAIRYGGDEFVIITNYSSKDLSTKITDEVFSFLNTHIPQVIIKIRNDSFNNWIDLLIMGNLIKINYINYVFLKKI